MSKISTDVICVMVGHQFHHTVADNPTSFAERHCRLDSFAMADQAAALLRVDERTDAYEWS